MLTAEKLHTLIIQAAQELWGVDKISVPYASIPEWMAKQQARLAELINQEFAPLEARLESGQNGLDCLRAYLEQLPNSQIFLGLINIWFAEFEGKAP